MPSPPQTPADSSLLGGCKDVGSASYLQHALQALLGVLQRRDVGDAVVFVEDQLLRDRYRTSARVSHTEADGGGHVKTWLR